MERLYCSDKKFNRSRQAARNEQPEFDAFKERRQAYFYEEEEYIKGNNDISQRQ